MVVISNPLRPLDRGVEMTRFEFICNKIVPYVLVACVIILLILMVVVFAKYGGAITGTEANHWQNMESLV